MNRTTNWMLLGAAMTVLSAIGACAGTARHGGGSHGGEG